jgi:hypothetical protein
MRARQLILAWRVVSGSAAARIIGIVCSMFGMAIVLVGAGSTGEPWVRLGLLGGYPFQLALLVSTPVWERTRPARSAWLPTASLWPRPRLRTLFAGLGAGLIITLLPAGFTRLHAIASCPALPGLVSPREQAHAHCQQNVAGIPRGPRSLSAARPSQCPVSEAGGLARTPRAAP